MRLFRTIVLFYPLSFFIQTLFSSSLLFDLPIFDFFLSKMVQLFAFLPFQKKFYYCAVQVALVHALFLTFLLSSFFPSFHPPCFTFLATLFLFLFPTFFFALLFLFFLIWYPYNQPLSILQSLTTTLHPKTHQIWDLVRYTTKIPSFFFFFSFSFFLLFFNLFFFPQFWFFLRNLWDFDEMSKFHPPNLILGGKKKKRMSEKIEKPKKKRKEKDWKVVWHRRGEIRGSIWDLLQGIGLSWRLASAFAHCMKSMHKGLKLYDINASISWTKSLFPTDARVSEPASKQMCAEKHTSKASRID